MRRLRRFAIWGVPVILVLMGIVFYFLASKVELGKEEIPLLLGIINTKKLLGDIASGLFIVGVIGFALQIYEITKFFDERLTRFFSTKLFLNHLAPTTLKDLHKHLTGLIWNVKEIKKGGLYHFINTDVYPYLTRPFRRNYEAHMDSRILEDVDGVVERVTETDYDVENPLKGKTDFTIEMTSRQKKIAGLDKKLVEVEFIEVDGKMAKGVKFEEIREKETETQVFYSLTHKIKVKGSTHVKVKTKRYIPIDDKDFSLSMIDPTSSFYLDFVFPGDYRFHAEIFAIAATPKCVHNTIHGIRIKYKGWMLPWHAIIIHREDKKTKKRNATK